MIIYLLILGSDKMELIPMKTTGWKDEMIFVPGGGLISYILQCASGYFSCRNIF
jgi:hypothetical protein